MTRPRSVLITGATSGIGRALALAYSAPGVRLLLVGRDGGRMAEVAAACGSRGATVVSSLIDVTDRAALAAWAGAAASDAPIDLAIACAGITSGIAPGRPTEDPEAVRAVLAVDLLGAIATADAVLPAMLARGEGHVAFIGSLAGLRGLPYSPAYSAAKAGLHAYAEALRPTLRMQGITVSLVAPGFVETPLNSDIVAPRPFLVSATRAAVLIKRGLDRRRAMIAFPWPLYLGLRLLNLMPARFGDWLLSRPQVAVPETAERIGPEGPRA